MHSGTIGGAVTLNGFPKEARSFSRLTGYVEQQDIHTSFATVGESIAFAAALRLPGSVSADRRAAFCAEVETLLGMAGLHDRLVGDVGAPDGLAPGERKARTVFLCFLLFSHHSHLFPRCSPWQ